MKMQEACEIYVIAPRIDKGQRTVKVGISNNSRSRLSSIQTGSPVLLSIKAAFTLPSRHSASFIESQFHSHFCFAKLEGEWFDIEPEVATYILAREVEYFAADSVSISDLETAMAYAVSTGKFDEQFLSSWWNDLLCAEGLAA